MARPAVALAVILACAMASCSHAATGKLPQGLILVDNVAADVGTFALDVPLTHSALAAAKVPSQQALGLDWVGTNKRGCSDACNGNGLRSTQFCAAEILATLWPGKNTGSSCELGYASNTTNPPEWEVKYLKLGRNKGFTCGCARGSYSWTAGVGGNCSGSTPVKQALCRWRGPGKIKHFGWVASANGGLTTCIFAYYKQVVGGLAFDYLCTASP